MNAPLRYLPMSLAAIPVPLRADLRSDLAGEVGAVNIYRGMLAVSRDEGLRTFARHHLRTEEAHLAFFNACLPPALHSRLLWLWSLAGWLLGAVSALAGPRFAYQTVESVETFVDEHYSDQVATLLLEDPDNPLLAVLEDFRQDEMAHRDDAAARGGQAPRWWDRIVRVGSKAGVAVSRRF